MRDLLCFRLLSSRAYDDARLPDLLEALARLGARERVPFFGPLLDLLDDAAAAPLHARALACLGDADGWLGVDAVVRAIGSGPPAGEDDATPLDARRTAAVEALRSIATRQPTRWVHALFHSDPAVRALAVEGGAAEKASELTFYLLADEALRPRVLARAQDGVPPCPAGAVGVLLDYARDGVIPPALARTLLRARSKELVEWLKGARARPDAAVDPYIASSYPGPPEERLLEASGDDVDRVLDLFWDVPAELAEVYAPLARSPVSRRALVSLIRMARVRGGFPEALLGLIFCAFPPMIHWGWLGADVRREAARRGMERGPLFQMSPAYLQPHLFAALCLHPDGGPDLRVIAPLARMLQKEPYERLEEWVGLENLARAVDARPAESAPVLLLPDKDVTGALKLVNAMTVPASRRTVLRVFAEKAAVHQLVFLGQVARDDLRAVLGAMVNARLPAPRATRIAEIAADALGAELGSFLVRWRAPHGEEEGDTLDLGLCILHVTARSMPAELFAETVAKAPNLLALLGAIDGSPSFPYGPEAALAHRLVEHAHPAVAEWARARVALEPAPEPAARMPDDMALRDIVTCKRAELASKVAPFARGGRKGLAAALSRRTDGPVPDAAVCLALLASLDPPAEADAMLLRYGSEDPTFVRDLDAALVRAFIDRDADLNLLGHAALWRWERHGRALLEGAVALFGDLAGAVRGLRALRFGPVRADALAGLSDALAVLASRDRPRFDALAGAAAFEALLEGLGEPVGPQCAGALRVLARAMPAVAEPFEPRVRLMLPDLDAGTRERLSRWIDSVGLPARPPPRPPPREPDIGALARVRASTRVEEIAPYCRSEHLALVHEATLRLIELGVEGCAHLAAVIEAADAAPAVQPILDSVPLWDRCPALDRLRARSADTSAPRDVRFALSLAFAERGEAGALASAIERAREPSEARWFQPAHWDRLVALGVPPLELAIELAASEHPHAYLRAVPLLMAEGEGARSVAALRAFLDEGTGRMGSLRRSAAHHLHARGDFFAFSLVMQQELESSRASTLLAGAPRELVLTTTRSFLAAGNSLAKEGSLLGHLAPTSVDMVAKEEAYEMVLTCSASDPIRQRAANSVRYGLGRFHKLTRVAETFAWGVRTGMELVGKKYRVQMTGGQSLGHTRLRERRVFVTPLPILRGDKNGREIVEGLILHELGHHMYHRGKEADAAWNEAQQEGIHGLLNLVADEHLERNLRALDASYGDRLKRLAAYAFQHTDRDIEVQKLLAHLGAAAAVVLPISRLGVSRDPDSVVVESGPLLFAMERSGLAFSRFVRALRMGLGNRHDDPLVAEALELFDGRFRHKTMPELLEVAHQLRDLFGWEVHLVESFGPHESLEQSRSDEIIWGEGISQEEVDREVERVLDPRARDDREGPSVPGGKPWINIAPKNDFDRITYVERVPFDAAEYAAFARQVQRPARLMRQYLEQLGLSHVPQRMRLRGRRLDRTRVLPMILRGEPRVLVARETRVTTDLFLGIVIDCSGSMQSRDNIAKARLFGTLLAEAARGMRGVDLRVFGFTDKVIYDCGDASRCAAYALDAGGGNNDAAALYHVAGVAKASPRKAKLLVMISDGLPTECSVAALRELVVTLTRRFRMVCAQVAVQPLAEVCFPHYVVCDDDTIDKTVARFGRIVAQLVARTLSS